MSASHRQVVQSRQLVRPGYRSRDTHGGGRCRGGSGRVIFFGELGLDGRLRPVRGVLPAVAAAAEEGFAKVMVAEQNAAEAVLVPGVRVIAASSLSCAADWLRGTPGLSGGPRAVEFEGGHELSGGRAVYGQRTGANVAPGGLNGSARPASNPDAAMPDLAEMLGQSTARRAAEVCAAGGHHLSLLGPPGAGKTMLAERIPTILPRLDTAAALEVTAIHSVAGTLPPHVPLLTDPPFIAPHHTATKAAMSVVAAESSSLAQHHWPTEAFCSSMKRQSSPRTCSTPCDSRLRQARSW